MNLKELSMNKFLRSKFSKKIRNFLNIKPSFDLVDYTLKNISVSDAFFWRTDDGFKTIFRFTNIIKFFYGEKELDLKVIFFDRNNKFIKKIYISSTTSNELVIDKSFLNNISSYGVFYVFHKSSNKFNGIIRNSCYTGYSFKNSIPSFVHGNIIVAEQNLENMKITYGLGGVSFFKKFTYKIQNYFNYEATEIMLINPTKKKINILVNDNELNLDKGCSIIVKINKSKLIEITSNCYLLRPIVFTYNNSFFDVYHG